MAPLMSLPNDLLILCCEFLSLGEVASMARICKKSCGLFTISLAQIPTFGPTPHMPAPAPPSAPARLPGTPPASPRSLPKPYLSRRKTLSVLAHGGWAFDAEDLAIDVCWRMTSLERLTLRCMRSVQAPSLVLFFQSLTANTENTLKHVDLTLTGNHVLCVLPYIVN